MIDPNIDPKTKKITLCDQFPYNGPFLRMQRLSCRHEAESNEKVEHIFVVRSCLLPTLTK
jgi:hypothetical protein